jgi:hypothetical protein
VQGRDLIVGFPPLGRRENRRSVLVVLDRHQRRAGTSIFFFLFLFVPAFLILWVSTSLCRWQADHRQAQLRQWDFNFTSSAVWLGWNVACAYPSKHIEFYCTNTMAQYCGVINVASPIDNVGIFNIPGRLQGPSRIKVFGHL